MLNLSHHEIVAPGFLDLEHEIYRLIVTLEKFISVLRHILWTIRSQQIVQHNIDYAARYSFQNTVIKLAKIG